MRHNTTCLFTVAARVLQDFRHYLLDSSSLDIGRQHKLRLHIDFAKETPSLLGFA